MPAPSLPREGLQEGDRKGAAAIPEKFTPICRRYEPQADTVSKILPLATLR